MGIGIEMALIMLASSPLFPALLLSSLMVSLEMLATTTSALIDILD